MADKDKRANGSAADDAEFEKLLDEMDELGRQADALRAKVNHLIDEMRENDVPADEEVDGASSDEGSAADGEAHDAVSSEESGDISVNGHDEAGHNSGEAHVEVEKVNEDDDEDLAIDADTDAAGKATDEDGDPDAA
ncbi:MAG: hypothetical protein F4207_10540 [Gemmatimonadetes bacterium]|nr:hypothetical protein [Gemmatimonadota bacterium]MYG16844.1 hypothetical protein [Gemmatimonadota bacterium]